MKRQTKKNLEQAAMDIDAELYGWPNESELESGDLITRCIADIEAKPIRWLWPGRIARGKLTVLAGHPGLGKSQVTASVAAIVTSSGLWPDTRQECQPGTFIFLNAEDDPADTLRPRLEAAGADLRRVHIVDAVVSGFLGDGSPGERGFSLEEDVARLGELLKRLGDVAGVVIDPISAYMGRVDSHKNAEVRAVLAPLASMAAKHDSAMIAVSHLSKAGGPSALMRVIGSLAFGAAARAAHLIAPDPKDHARRLFLQMKNNLAPDEGGLAFRIEGCNVPGVTGSIATSRVSWESEPVTETADDILFAQETRKEKHTAVDSAADFLRQVLELGPVSVNQIEQEAKAAGCSWMSVRRAADAIGVEKEKYGLKDGWYWGLPAENRNKPNSC